MALFVVQTSYHLFIAVSSPCPNSKRSHTLKERLQSTRSFLHYCCSPRQRYTPIFHGQPVRTTRKPDTSERQCTFRTRESLTCFTSTCPLSALLPEYRLPSSATQHTTGNLIRRDRRIAANGHWKSNSLHLGYCQNSESAVYLNLPKIVL